jgi:hypothetical protein
MSAPNELAAISDSSSAASSCRLSTSGATKPLPSLGGVCSGGWKSAEDGVAVVMVKLRLDVSWAKHKKAALKRH